MSAEPDEAAFVAALDRVSAAHPDLDPLAAGVLAALDLGLPGDSRAFARTFGVEHALVLRALSGLEEAGLVAVTARDGRTQRTRYTTADSGSSVPSSRA
ncbi:MarR family transcriptional regulator [Methylobacterium sp. A52T]